MVPEPGGKIDPSPFALGLLAEAATQEPPDGDSSGIDVGM